jgi:hypothetical protein
MTSGATPSIRNGTLSTQKWRVFSNGWNRLTLSAYRMSGAWCTSCIRVRLARNFTWRKNGPIQRFFEERVQQQFFQSSFLEKSELRLMVHGSISARSNELLQQRLQRIAEEFDSFVEQDKRLDHEMREGTTLVMAIRAWGLGLFADLRGKATDHDPPGAPRRKR